MPERIMFTTNIHVNYKLNVQPGDYGWRHEHTCNTNVPYYKCTADKRPEQTFNTHSDNFMVLT
jgi:hypothetical protein